MNFQWPLSLGLLFLAGCSTTQPTPDFFTARDQFAANRELETTVFEDVAYDAMLGHVLESLLDLNCTLKEANKKFGVISANGAPRFFNISAGLMYFAGCAGHKVTVTVFETPTRQLRVRATFTPADPRANKTFKLLLERSIAHASAGVNI